jgi:hypothetical protein
MTDTKPEPQHVFYDSTETSSDADARELAALGKKSVLRVSLPRYLEVPPLIACEAQLLALRGSRALVRHDNYMGGLLLRLHLRATQRGTSRSNLRLLAMLGWLGSCRCHHGGDGEHVADSWRAVPLDVYACARGMERAVELCDWMVCHSTQ